MTSKTLLKINIHKVAQRHLLCSWFGVVGSNVGQINEVALCPARLVLEWVTIREIYLCLTNHSGQLSLGRRNEYRPKGGDALWLASNGRYGSCLVTVKTV